MLKTAERVAGWTAGGTYRPGWGSKLTGLLSGQQGEWADLAHEGDLMGPKRPELEQPFGHDLSYDGLVPALLQGPCGPAPTCATFFFRGPEP